MPKHNTARVRAKTRSPVTSERAGTTYEGGPGYARNAQGELFLLGVTNLGSQKTFYEGARPRDSRFANLVRQVATEDPAWLLGYLPWLRTEAFMRNAPVVGMVEGVRAMVAGNVPGGRLLAARVPARGDEPGEAVAYHLVTYGKALPKPLKRGLGEACDRLYTQRSLIRYDIPTRAIRFGDVLEMCHPAGLPGDWLLTREGEPAGPQERLAYLQRQNALYRYALARRHNRSDTIPAELWMVREHAQLLAEAQQDAAVLLDTDRLGRSGMRWETGLMVAGDRVAKRALWEAYIPVMGVEAILKNLRNFDEEGVSDEVAAVAAAKLTDPEEVARSRQFPMRWLTAHRVAPNLRWGAPLDKGLALSLSNIPELRGRTLVLVDTSTSMDDPFTYHGQDGEEVTDALRRWDAAVLFGCAVASRCEHADVVSFSGRQWTHERREARTKVFPLQRGESLLRTLLRWRSGGYFLGGGTDTDLALRAHWRDHDRVLIVTDEQGAGAGGYYGVPLAEVAQQRPAHVPLYVFNLAGYARGQVPSGGVENCHVFGGLTDACFRMVPLLEAGRDAKWPWQQQAWPVAPQVAHARTARRS